MAKKKFLKKSMYRVEDLKKRKSSTKYKRKRYSRIQSGALGSPFPTSKVCKLRYFDQYTLSQASSVPRVYQWHLNSLYDFDKTSAGHQPYYYDQLTPLYNQYRVYSVIIEYSMVASADCTIVFRSTSEAAAPAATVIGFDTENERYGSKTIAFSSGGTAVKGVLKYNIRHILGYSKSAYNSDDRTAGPVTSNPSLLAYLNAVMYSPSSSCDATLNFKVSFLSKFFDPVYPTQS